MVQVFKNNAWATLAAPLAANQTSLSLVSGLAANFPALNNNDFFLATLVGLNANGNEDKWEVVKCTARNGASLTITRAQEGTTGQEWPAGTRVEMRLTAGTLDSFTDEAEAKAAAPVQKVFGRTGDVVLQGDDVTTALGFSPLNQAEKGTANGVTPLDDTGKVSPEFLPSYVDDVLEFDDLPSFPAIGERGKIYVALDSNLTYRWSGSTYIEISPAPDMSGYVKADGSTPFTGAVRAKVNPSGTADSGYTFDGGEGTGIFSRTGEDLRICVRGVPMVMKIDQSGITTSFPLKTVEGAQAPIGLNEKGYDFGRFDTGMRSWSGRDLKFYLDGNDVLNILTEGAWFNVPVRGITPSVDDDSTKFATTEFVRRLLVPPAVDLSGYAPKDSPAFTGRPTAPTPDVNSKSDRIATTAMVQEVVKKITPNDYITARWASSDGTKWYRLYNSGFIEQGGFAGDWVDWDSVITLPIPMANAKFAIYVQPTNLQSWDAVHVESVDQYKFRIGARDRGNTTGAKALNWLVVGQRS